MHVNEKKENYIGLQLITGVEKKGLMEPKPFPYKIKTIF